MIAPVTPSLKKSVRRLLAVRWEKSMKRAVVLSALFPVLVLAQASDTDAVLGQQLADKSVEIRRQITNPSGPAEPFKIIGNLYFVGVQNGDAYLLTSPQGHILFGAGYPDTGEGIEKNIIAMGFKMSDVKVILINHGHLDQGGSAQYLKEKTGAQVMAGFAEIPFLEHGGTLPAGTAIPNLPPAPQAQQPNNPGTPGPAPTGPGGQRFPPVKVERGLFDGDVVKVGSSTVTAYFVPGHSPSSTSFVFNVRDGNREYKAIQFCCWEYPEDIGRAAYVNEASVRRALQNLRKIGPIDIYMELGRYAWGGVVNQPGNLTFAERIENVKKNPMLMVNRDVFRQWTAAREVEFDRKLAKLKGTSPIYK